MVRPTVQLAPPPARPAADSSHAGSFVAQTPKAHAMEYEVVQTPRSCEVVDWEIVDDDAEGAVPSVACRPGAGSGSASGGTVGVKRSATSPAPAPEHHQPKARTEAPSVPASSGQGSGAVRGRSTSVGSETSTGGGVRSGPPRSGARFSAKVPPIHFARGQGDSGADGSQGLGGVTPVVSGRPAVSDYRLSQPGLSAGFSHVVYTSSGERVASARSVQGAVPTQARESVLSPRGGTNAFNVFGGASAVALTSTTMPDVAAGKGDVGKHGRPSGPYQREER